MGKAANVQLLNLVRMLDILRMLDHVRMLDLVKMPDLVKMLNLGRIPALVRMLNLVKMRKISQMQDGFAMTVLYFRPDITVRIYPSTSVEHRGSTAFNIGCLAGIRCLLHV